MFGYIITFDVNDIRMAVLDRDRTTQSRDLVDAFRSSGYFQVTAPARRRRARSRRS